MSLFDLGILSTSHHHHHRCPSSCTLSPPATSSAAQPPPVHHSSQPTTPAPSTTTILTYVAPHSHQTLTLIFPLRQVLETEKKRNLSNNQHSTSTPIRNAPGWNQYLASASEAAVKVCSTLFTISLMPLTRSNAYQADRSDHTFAELAAETVAHVKARHHDTDSPSSDPDRAPSTPASAANGEDRVDAYEAVYERDDLTGPLNNPAPKENIERVTIKERVSPEDRHLSRGP